MKGIGFVLFLSAFFVEIKAHRSHYDPAEEWLSSDVYEDSILDVPGLLAKYGYYADRHLVTTHDGYILQLFRVKSSYSQHHHKGSGVPVLMVHGFLGSASDFVLRLPEKSLGTMLADHGYDVWLLNLRGNYYSKHHVSKKTSDISFWKFSFHESGVYDLPAAIDYVLAKNGASKLHLVSFSLGSNAIFVMGSKKPSYNQKIITVNAMAPAVYLKHTGNKPLRRTARIIIPFVTENMKYLGHAEIFPRSNNTRKLAAFTCGKLKPKSDLCRRTFSEYSHYANFTRIPVYLGHEPAGSSYKQLNHISQLHVSGRFAAYDYGIENIVKYKDFIPPEYKLKKVTAPVAIHYSKGDEFINERDVKTLKDKLPNVIGFFKVDRDNFNHFDFKFASDAIQVYERILYIMSKFH